MKLLEDKIRKDGKVFDGNVLKVDSFLNHQLDVAFLAKLGKEFAKRFDGLNITKVLTIEASGIAVATLTAMALKVPVLFAKKSTASNMDSNILTASVRSYTHHTTYEIRVASDYLTKEDRVLIIDDFLAHGEATRGLASLVQAADATLVGVGIVIEKGFQEGGDELRRQGVRVESLAIVDDMTNGKITFRNQK